MKIKEQTRKLAARCSKHCFEVADGELTKSAQNTVLRCSCSKHCFEVADGEADVV
ncbi:hypothetical protein [Streptococcus pneumoniae]|uniref:hypothetical protein n=1 Tax=Streptococcus pneumoniae TaxID=1313 RepID=UPI0015DBCCE7|nr:hypothetical protein [Streptococcus pneumoniae]